VKRRDALSAIGRRCARAALLAAPLRSFAQPSGRIARIGFLSGSSDDPINLRTIAEPVRQGLREAGWVEGRDIAIEWRWAQGQPARLAGLAAELLALDPAVIMAVGPGPALTLKGMTTTVPIVASAVDDPVLMGLAQSMARPGGNITGVSSWGIELLAKRLQLLKEILPEARRFGVVANPHTVNPTELSGPLRAYERSMRMDIALAQAGRPEDYPAVFAALARDRVDGLVILADATFWVHAERLRALCAEHRLPAIWGGRGWAEAGGLASYQSDFPAVHRRAAALVDKILKGTKAGEIPFEQATKLELVINLKTARALGLKIPQALLLSADAVIE
jgi:putative ABC transport system substrate-binding protein